MCKKSTKILHSYLTELIGSNQKPKDFINSELKVRLSPLTVHNVHKRKRITKEQRCSLLKRLLAPNGKFKERDKSDSHSTNWQNGGLKEILNFTRNYEFGWHQNEPTHLDKLQEFSTNFFQNDFTEFRDTILYIIDNKDNFSDSEDEDDCDLEEMIVKQESAKFEEVLVEPDIKIKREIEYEESVSPYNFVETEMQCKEECIEESEDFTTQSSFTTDLPNNKSHFCDQNSMYMLDKFVDSYAHNNIIRKSFSSQNVRCRTRNNPYISPILKEQFFLKSFRCEQCNRYFKSLAYLKSHNSKVHTFSN